MLAGEVRHRLAEFEKKLLMRGVCFAMRRTRALCHRVELGAIRSFIAGVPLFAPGIAADGVAAQFPESRPYRHV